MRNMTLEELALLVLPLGGNRYAPRPDESNVPVIRNCGVLSVVVNEDAMGATRVQACELVCRLLDDEGVEWWCPADFVHTTRAEATTYLLDAPLSRLAELKDDNAMEGL